MWPWFQNICKHFWNLGDVKYLSIHHWKCNTRQFLDFLIWDFFKRRGKKNSNFLIIDSRWDENLKRRGGGECLISNNFFNIGWKEIFTFWKMLTCNHTRSRRVKWWWWWWWRVLFLLFIFQIIIPTFSYSWTRASVACTWHFGPILHPTSPPPPLFSFVT